MRKYQPKKSKESKINILGVKGLKESTRKLEISFLDLIIDSVLKQSR